VRSPWMAPLTVVGLLVLMRCVAQGQSINPMEKWKACQPARPVAAGTLRLLTGPKDGYYYKVGKSIATVFSDEAGRRNSAPLIAAVSTPQTSCNLVGLETHNADMALVQSDIVHDAWYGHPPTGTTSLDSVTLIAPLFVETVHILVRPHLNVARLADFRGRRVWLGPLGSLTVLSARRILDATGLTPTEVGAVENQCADPASVHDPVVSCKMINQLEREEALTALQKLQLDAVFLVGAYPFDPVRDKMVPAPPSVGTLTTPDAGRCRAIRQQRLDHPANDHEIRLFNLDVELVDRLVQDGSYIEQLIPANTYCQANATLTVGVRALLVTNLGGADPVVSQVAQALFDHQKAIEAALKGEVETEQHSHVDPETGLPAKLGLLRTRTPDTLYWRYHDTIKTHEIYFHPWRLYLQRGVPLIVAGALLVGFVLYRWRRRIGGILLNRVELAAGFLGLVLVWITASMLLYYCEGNVNEEYDTVSASMIATFQDLWPYADEPLTPTGQHYWQICRGAAIFIVGGMLFPSVQKSVGPRLRRRVRRWLLALGQPKKAASAAGSGHSVVINPPHDDLDDSVRIGSTEGIESMVVISERPVIVPPLPPHVGVTVIEGDPTIDECLRSAGIPGARSVTICSDWPSPDPTDRRKHLRGDLADARTIQTLRAVHRLCGRGPVRLIAELKSQKNRSAAYQAAPGAAIRIMSETPTELR
jgi:TRAP-type uncharacterized transport system substrate-binding protein